jgi:hypothetical protein
MSGTLFRDGNNNLGTLETLVSLDGNTLPQSAPSDPTGKPYGAANPLPVSVSGIAQVAMNGLGPLPVDISVSIVAANPVEAPDLPLAVGGGGLGFKLDLLLLEMRTLTMMFAQQCGIDIDDLRDNVWASQEDGADSLSTAQSSYSN